MFKKQNKKGFTLIEILVVITIIGLAVSIILVALSPSRKKGKDSRIQQDLVQAGTQAAMIYNETGLTSYSDLCNSTTLCDLNICPTGKHANELGKLKRDIIAQGGAIACYSNNLAFCLSSSLPGGGHYCIDNTGTKKKTTSGTGFCDTVENCQN